MSKGGRGSISSKYGHGPDDVYRQSGYRYHNERGSFDADTDSRGFSSTLPTFAPYSSSIPQNQINHNLSRHGHRYDLPASDTNFTGQQISGQFNGPNNYSSRTTPQIFDYVSIK